MRVFVSGANGLVGRYPVRYLSERCRIATPSFRLTPRKRSTSWQPLLRRRPWPVGLYAEIKRDAERYACDAGR